MKKILFLLLILVFVFSAAGCGLPSDEPSSSQDVTTTTNTQTSVINTVASTDTSSNPATGGAVSGNVTTSKTSHTATTTTSKPTTTTSNAPIRDIVTVPSAPAYNGVYLEDISVGSLKYDYDSLRAKLTSYVSANSPTKTTGTSEIYDLSGLLADYSILGYVSGKLDTADISVSARNGGTVTSFNLKTTAAYKTPEFTEALVKQEIEKLTVFTGNSEINYFIAYEFGNPDEYKNYDELNATKYAQNIYKGTDEKSFISIHFLNPDKSLKALLTVGTKNENGVLKYTSSLQVYYKN